MAEISYDAGKTANVINELNNAKSQLNGTTQALQSAVNVILSARGIEQVDTSMLPGIIEMPNKCQEKLSKQANQISTSAEKVEAYNADVSGANGLVRMFASKFMFHTFLIEGVLTAGEQIVDGAASAVGWIAGFWDKDTEENIAKWIRKDHVGDFFAEQYGEGGSLYEMNKYSYISANGTAANLIKVAGIATGYALTVAAGGAALGAVSGAVAGTGAVAGAASGASLASSSVFAQAAVAGVGGLGSGTQSGLRQQSEDNLNFNEALKQGVKQGAIQAGTVFAVNAALPYISKGVSALKGTFSGNTTSTALTVVDDASSATSTALSTVDDFADDTLESMTEKLYNKEITVDEFKNWATQNKASVYAERDYLINEGKWDSIYQKGHEVFVDNLPEANVVDDVVSDVSSSNAASETINPTAESVVNNIAPISNSTTGSTISSEVSGVSDDVVSGISNEVSGASDDVVSGLQTVSQNPNVAPIATESSNSLGSVASESSEGITSGLATSTASTVGTANSPENINIADTGSITKPTGNSITDINTTPNEFSDTTTFNTSPDSNTIVENTPAPSNAAINTSSTEASGIATQTPTNTNIVESTPNEPPVIPSEPATSSSTFQPAQSTGGNPAITVAQQPDDPNPSPLTNLNISQPSVQEPTPSIDATPTDYPETTPTGTTPVDTTSSNSFGTTPIDSTPSTSSGTTPISDNSTNGIINSQPDNPISDTITNTPENIQETIAEPEITSDSPNPTPEQSYQPEPEIISDSPYSNTIEQTENIEPSLNEYETIPNTNINEYEEIPNTNVNDNSNNIKDYFTAGIIGAVGGATSAIVGSNIKNKKEKEKEEERIEEI